MKHAPSMIALSVALLATCGSSGIVRAAGNEAGVALLAFSQGPSVVDNSVLAEQRGGADVHEVQLSKIWANGSVSEVQAYDLVTGSNIVSEGSLANASGMPMLIQNSGNGVLIQNVVILNVEVR